MDELEPIPLSPADELSPPTTPTPAVRDRFLVALAVVVAIAVIALAIQLRAIASSQEDETRCTRALVAMVAQGDPRNPENRELVRECVGGDADEDDDEDSAASGSGG